MLTTGSIISKNSGLLASSLDKEIVMMSVENNEYYGLNKVGSRIWQIIETPTAVERIIDIMMKEYKIDRSTCTADVMEYLNELESKNLIRVS